MSSLGASLRTDWKFLGYLLMYLVLFLLLGQVSLEFLQNVKTFTASAVTFLWTALSFPVTSTGSLVNFYEFPMDVTLECTALHYIIIFLAGVLAFHSHALYYRMLGIILGVTAILFLNILRIGVLGIIGHYANGMFDFIHTYLWQGTFALMVLLIWILWVNGRSMIQKTCMKNILYSFLFASVSVCIMIASMNYYAIVLAFAADAVFGVVSSITGMNVGVISNHGDIGYIYQDSVMYNKISMEVINSALFFALAAFSAMSSSTVVFTKRLAAGAVLLFVQHLVDIIMYGIILRQGMDDDSFAILLWFTRGITIAAPILIWLLVVKIFRANHDC